MKPNEQLLEAINDLDEHLITDALIQPQQPAQRGRKRIRILALAAVLAVCFTACGIHSLSVWYQEYFTGQSEGELNREQKTYLEKNVAEVTTEKTQGAKGEPGLTIESALTDGIQIYMKLRVIAEEGVSLSAPENSHVTVCPGNDSFGAEDSRKDVITLDGHRVYNTLRYLPVEDGDGLNNTMDYLVLGMLEGYWDTESGTEVPLELEGKTLRIVLEDFYQKTSNENYEIVETQQILTGRWEFDLTVTADSLNTRELISAPVEASLRYLDMEAEEKTFCWEPVPVTYITARALSLDIGYDKLGFGGDFGQTIRAVMTDGTEISLKSPWSGITFTRYFPDTPMMIDRIDHLVLEDGTVIQAG